MLICFPGALGDVHDLRTGRIPITLSAAPLQQSSSGRLPAFSPHHNAIDSQDARPPWGLQSHDLGPWEVSDSCSVRMCSAHRISPQLGLPAAACSGARSSPWSQ